jgi:tRNA-Thr(GGU) m(6)t(6)A37 methyltransferase TsaA
MGPESLLTVKPIGRVIVGRARGAEGDRWEEAESEIAVGAAWVDALDGLGEFSHLWVIWWLEAADDAPIRLRVHPQRRPDLPLVGLFATRSPRRPNPIAITAVRLLAREGGRLLVQGLDAFEGSAVLDLKPYLPKGDQIADSYGPEWLNRL